MHDPCHAVWVALERADCDPHGPEHSFRSACPAHGGDNRDALVVREGADGAAILYCHAHQCTTKELVRALGMSMSELFPDHHRQAPRRRRPPRVRQQHPAVVILSALSVNGIHYRNTANQHMYVAERCPACGFPDMWVFRDGRDVRVCCMEGCTPTEIVRALTANIWGEHRREMLDLSVTDSSVPDGWVNPEPGELEQ